jgi:hypothetical protein
MSIDLLEAVEKTLASMDSHPLMTVSEVIRVRLSTLRAHSALPDQL